MLAVIDNRVRALGVDDNGTVMSELLLQSRMAVIPICPRLNDREFIHEGRARLDARKADPRHTVHLERQQQAVPMDRAFDIEVVYHVEPRRSDEHKSELPSLMRISYAVFCFKKTKHTNNKYKR